MRYQTHMVTSLTAAYGIQCVLSFPLSFGYYGGVALGCLLPDIDEPNSYIGRRSFGLGKVVNKLFGHRGLTHSLTFTAITSIGFIVAPSPFMAGLSLGYLFHILEDALSVSGVPLLAPFSKRKYKLPLYKTGKTSEAVIMLLSIALFTFLLVTT